MKQGFLAFSIAMLLASTALAQFTSLPKSPATDDHNQDTPPPVIGKGSISGTVVNSLTKEPVKRARVTLNGPTNLNAVTDGSGSFTFRALPPGGYMVMANHDDFSMNRNGMNVSAMLPLGDGEEKRGVEVALLPGGSISGRVVDDDNVGLGNCNVTATRSEQVHGRPRTQMSSGTSTDDEGRYRIHSLERGRYVLKANCPTTYQAPHGFMKRNDPMIPMEGYAPVNIGGGSGGESGGLRLSAGSELNGVDFQMKRVPVFAIKGTLTGVDRSLLSGVQITLSPLGESGSQESGFNLHYDPSQGNFLFRHIPAGNYELAARAFNSERAYEGIQTVEIGKARMTEVELKLSAGAVVAGSVDFDDPNQRFENFQISLQPMVENYRGPYPMATLGKSGEFEFKSVLPGRFRMNPLPLGYIKAVTVAGRDVNPNDFEIGEGSAGPMRISVGSKTAKVEMELSPRPPAGQQVSGMLVPDNGPAVPDGHNIAFGGPNGEVDFPSVAPGKYHAFALETNNVWNLIQGDVFKSLESSGVAVTVAEGDDKRVSAHVVSAEDLAKALEASE